MRKKLGKVVNTLKETDKELEKIAEKTAQTARIWLKITLKKLQLFSTFFSEDWDKRFEDLHKREEKIISIIEDNLDYAIDKVSDIQDSISEFKPTKEVKESFDELKDILKFVKKHYSKIKKRLSLEKKHIEGKAEREKVIKQFKKELSLYHELVHKINPETTEKLVSRAEKAGIKFKGAAKGVLAGAISGVGLGFVGSMFFKTFATGQGRPNDEISTIGNIVFFTVSGIGLVLGILSGLKSASEEIMNLEEKNFKEIASKTAEEL